MLNLAFEDLKIPLSIITHTLTSKGISYMHLSFILESKHYPQWSNHLIRVMTSSPCLVFIRTTGTIKPIILEHN